MANDSSQSDLKFVAFFFTKVAGDRSLPLLHAVNINDQQLIGVLSREFPLSVVSSTLFLPKLSMSLTSHFYLITNLKA